MDSHLIYQLIVGAAIFGVVMLFLRFISIMIGIAIMGVFIYYLTMATPSEKQDLKNCAVSIPTNITKLRVPTECYAFFNTVKNTIPDKLEEKAKEEGYKIKKEVEIQKNKIKENTNQ